MQAHSWMIYLIPSYSRDVQLDLLFTFLSDYVVTQEGSLYSSVWDSAEMRIDWLCYFFSSVQGFCERLGFSDNYNEGAN